ncbi:MAG: TldD/PmbA family protein [Synergistaceae bacterium]|jgi:PmbA protein|nr:TldD/PmbA family protein [Synergistaceae bacterium]
MLESGGRAKIEAAAGKLLDTARGMPGLLGADVLYARAEDYSLSMLDGEPEENSSGVSGGISLRCIGLDGRQGVATASGISEPSLRDLGEWSYKNCMASEPDEGVKLYEGSSPGEEASMRLFDEDMENVASAAFRMKICSDMTETARSQDKRVLSVRSASWSHGFAESFYASTTGLSLWKRGTRASCGVSVVLRDGESYEMGSYGQAGRFALDLDAEDIARTAVDRTLRILGGKPIPTGKYTLLLEPEVTASIVDEIGEMFCASEVHKGRSLMKGRLGRSIAGSAVTLIDDARLPRRLGSSPFDREGVPTGRTVLIDSGAANAYMYNLQHAAKDGTYSTGNASGGLSETPDVAPSNLILEPGADSPERMMKNVGRGFLVTELMGLHTINSVNGEFSLGAKGVFVENGSWCGAVAGVTIADNLIDFLKKITSVGNDLVFFGSTGAPSIVVEDVSIAGE